MAFNAVFGFVLALFIGHVAGQTNNLTCYKCQALHGDDDFYTCLQNPFSSSVERENCTDDKDTCQATVWNSVGFYAVRRRCATALDCEEAQNGTTPEHGQCCQNNTCNDRLFDVTTTEPPTTTMRTTTLPLTTAILVTTSTSSSLTTQAEGQTGGMSAGVIAGCSVAGVAVLLMAAGAIYYYIKHRKEKQDSATVLNSGPFYAVRRRCATALDCEEAQNDTTPDYAQCCTTDNCNNRSFDLTTTERPTTVTMTTTERPTALVTTQPPTTLATMISGRNSSNNNVNGGLIAGYVVLAVAILLTMIGIFYYCWRRKHNANKTTPQKGAEMPPWEMVSCDPATRVV
ncbi:hypothetical protein Bbelb_258710 [Branchiostoma belcheri]|nr:hypothetical protein Bbelb_258710 [Branchiostoma belcheri]